jgi:hypothetical protein
MNIISVKNSDIQVLQQDIKEHIVETNFMINLMYVINQGWIQHDLVGGGGGGGGALPALVPSCVGHVCRPPINLLHYCKVLLD